MGASSENGLFTVTSVSPNARPRPSAVNFLALTPRPVFRLRILLL